ncbi:MAG: DUF2179 domain-containing protein [candidate division KSB1 bacterium]|nr:DUF2179 domain-containing protein [candidate division KSB1 bacterium]
MSLAGSRVQALREDIRALLPEYQGYDDATVQSQTDRLLREHVRSQIAQLTLTLEGAGKALARGSSSEVGKAIERVRRKLQVIVDGLNESLKEGVATGTGALDGETRTKLYEYDLAIVRRVAKLRQEIDGIDPRAFEGEEENETLILLDDLVDGLSQDLFERDTLLEGQDEMEY